MYKVTIKFVRNLNEVTKQLTEEQLRSLINNTDWFTVAWATLVTPSGVSWDLKEKVINR
jgi:hypothetical protein